MPEVDAAAGLEEASAVGEGTNTLALFGVLIALYYIKVLEPSRVSSINFVVLDDLVESVVHLHRANAVLIKSSQILKISLLCLLPVNQLLNRFDRSLHGLRQLLPRSTVSLIVN